MAAAEDGRGQTEKGGSGVTPNGEALALRLPTI